MSNITVEDFLKKLQETHIYFQPNPGNGGDALIAFTTTQLFKKHNIKYSYINDSDDLTGKTVIFGGGGSFIDGYSGCSSFVKKWHSKAKELIILPHSINGHTELIKDLGDNVTIFCREQKSFDYVSGLNPNVRLYKDHDIVINYFKYFIPETEYSSYTNKLFQSILKKKILSLKLSTIRTLNIMRTDAEKTDIQIHADNIDLSNFINYDPLMTDEKTVKKTTVDIITFISKFKTVHTNRLHMAIVSAIIGKKVYFYNNSYYKNSEIYKYSLSKLSNVTFISNKA